MQIGREARGGAIHNVSNASPAQSMRVCSVSPYDQVCEAIAVDVASGTNAGTAKVALNLAANPEPNISIEGGELNCGGKAVSRSEDHITGAGLLLSSTGEAVLAPMMMSSKPSPLTSPAEATEPPLSSPAATPLILKPSTPARLESSMTPGYCDNATPAHALYRQSLEDRKTRPVWSMKRGRSHVVVLRTVLSGHPVAG